MSWFSLLPASLAFIETWAIRFFLLLGALAIIPWLMLLIYDIALFLFRIITYDIPIIGGRARNRPRPRAPSLSERPSGRPRAFSMTIPGMSNGDTSSAGDSGTELKRRLNKPKHSRNSSSAVVDE